MNFRGIRTKSVCDLYYRECPTARFASHVTFRILTQQVTRSAPKQHIPCTRSLPDHASKQARPISELNAHIIIEVSKFSLQLRLRVDQGQTQTVDSFIRHLVHYD